MVEHLFSIFWVKLITSSSICSNHNLPYASRIFSFHKSLIMILNSCSSHFSCYNSSFYALVKSAVDDLIMGSQLYDSAGLVNTQVEYSQVTCFQYSKAIIIAAAYPHFVPSGNTVCVVLMETPILANTFLIFSIDVWVGRKITFVMFFPRFPLLFLQRQSCQLT